MELGLDMAFYRTLDPGLGRWMEVDPKAEMGYGMSTYCSMGNSPMTHVDPEGDFPLFAIGFAAMTYMSSQAFSGNLTSTGDFYRSMAIGGAIGAASYGVGEFAAFLGGPYGQVTLGANGGIASLGLSSGTVAVAQAGAHAIVGGTISSLHGDGFWTGAISGGLSSGAASLAGNSAIAQIAVGGLAGGISSAAAGGSFIQGFSIGFFTSVVNHAAHNAKKLEDIRTRHKYRRLNQGETNDCLITCGANMTGMGVDDFRAAFIASGGRVNASGADIGDFINYFRLDDPGTIRGAMNGLRDGRHLLAIYALPRGLHAVLITRITTYTNGTIRKKYLNSQTAGIEVFRGTALETNNHFTFGLN